MRNEFIEKFAALITAALGLVAALAWNSAIQSIFTAFFSSERNTIWAMVSYAVLVTIIAILATLWIASLANKYKKIPEEKPKKKAKK